MYYFCQKYIMFEPKNVQRICVITLKNDAKPEEELACALKNDMSNLTNFDPTLESIPILTLMDSLWPNYIIFRLKKYRGIMYHYTEDQCKLWRKNNLWGFINDMRNLVNFTRALKNLKICTLRDFFVQAI